MKKNLLIAAIALLAVAFVSCQKDGVYNPKHKIATVSQEWTRTIVTEDANGSSTKIDSLKPYVAQEWSWGDKTLNSIVNKNSKICEKCFNKFQPKFIHFHIDKIDCLSIYEYDPTIRELLYKFKGCYDIELKDVFLDRYINYLKIKYYGYHIVPLPSYHLDDLKRGFNHVEEIYRRLNLPILKVLEKVKNEKQAKKNKKQRMRSNKTFEITDTSVIKNKKILLVDDVYTTGSSMNAAINLVKQGNPRKISVLVIAKNIERPKK